MCESKPCKKMLFFLVLRDWAISNASATCHGGVENVGPILSLGGRRKLELEGRKEKKKRLGS